jgi:uncharacterized RDD family membrane protein YckC
MQPPPLPNNPYAAPQAQVSDVWAQHESYVVQYAGFWLRFVALIIDWFITSIIGGIIGGILGVVLGLSMANSGSAENLAFYANLLGAGVGLIVSWLYYALTESSNWQATPGKKVLGLRVTDLSGAPIGFGRASGRYWGKLLSGLLLLVGYIMAGITEKKQALHDILAGTLVVRG